MRFSLVPLLANGIGLVSVFSSYIIAAIMGHIPLFLPDITHCGLYAPERFVFRGGFLPACLLLILQWHVVKICTDPLVSLPLSHTLSVCTYCQPQK